MRSTPFTPPPSPCTTRFSGSAREIRERLRGILSGSSRRPGKGLLLLSVGATLFCCFYLVSCRQAPADSGQAGDPLPSAAPSHLAQAALCDLNHNGIPEEIRLAGADGEQEVQIWENERLIAREEPGVCLCTLEGRDYILRRNSEVTSGSCRYHYTLADLSGAFEEDVRYDEVTFDLAFGTASHRDFDPEALAAYVEELNALLAHSVTLLQAEGALLIQPAQAERLDWLEGSPQIFAPDPEQSLAENLRAYQQAMAAAYPSPAPQGEASVLPLTEPLEMLFASGAGGWGTWLELDPDGTFTGEYCDSDMSVQFVCRFHGSFTDLSPLTDASWQLTLAELVLDTPYPVGAEWDAEGLHRISSQPYGFTDQEGEALRPGARFILYTPQAQGHAPGTELYGAAEFWSWWPDRHAFVSASDRLGCYGLHNLATGYGFFSA